MTKEDDPITRSFIGLAMMVHSSIGPGLTEETYHQELVRELNSAGIPHLSKPKQNLVYRGFVADTFEPDFVVQDHFIAELKALRGEFMPAHMVQLFCYCKFWRLRTSLLVDFGKQSLQWKRLLYQSHTSQLPEIEIPDFITDQVLAENIITAVGVCLNELGLGYRETTWNGLVTAALQGAALKLRINPTAKVHGHAEVSLSSLVVEETCAILVIALTDGTTASDRARLHTHLRWLNLDWGIIFHFGKTNANLCFVQRPSNMDGFRPADSGRPTD